MSLQVPNVTFHERVEDALNNPQLRGAFDRATARFTALRQNALHGLPGADDIRDRARLVRAHTLSQLDYYLARFADAVEAAGGQVHWAADAEAANRIVLDIARSGVRTVVKSKSMLNLVFIAGPSRTADIEMVITRGVHGPKRVCVVLIEGLTDSLQGQREPSRAIQNEFDSINLCVVNQVFTPEPCVEGEC